MAEDKPGAVYDTSHDGIVIISDGTPDGKVAALADTLRQAMRERDESLEEVERLRREVEFEANAEHTWLTRHPRVCACVPDAEAAALVDAGWSLPQCTVHPESGGA